MSKSNNNSSLKDQLCAIRENLKQFRNEMKSYDLASLLDNDNLKFQVDTKKNSNISDQKLTSTSSLKSLSEASENNNGNNVPVNDRKSKKSSQSISSKKNDFTDSDPNVVLSEASTSSQKQKSKLFKYYSK